MATGSTITTNGKKVLLYRTYTENGNLSSTQYLAPTQFRVGINNGTPLAADTSIDEAIPIEDGTVLDDGSNNLTGSSGADNSTDNTSTYKDGAGQTDVTAQNLIANDTNALKIWTYTLSTFGNSAQYTGLWLYIKDSTALAKFKSSGTAVEIKLGSDSSNYYSETWTAASLTTGWNWLNGNTDTLGDWTETGTVSGNIDTFIIEITTNNATDTFATGDVVYDLLRQWQASDLIEDIDVNYPSINFTTLEATTRCTLLTTKANGFLINGLEIRNEDTSPLMLSEDTVVADSKSDTDEFVYTVIDRVI